jgi:5'-nucleotidase (lipoprotein e(P4) family)
MPGWAAIKRAAGLLGLLSLAGCMLFEPPELLPPAGDACFSSVTPEQKPETAHGDYPYSWKCEATERKPMSNALHWFRNSAEYRALATAAYARAQEHLPGFARTHRDTGWIVVMDADETLLDNSEYTKEYEACGGGFWQPTWCDWSRTQRARAVPGAVAFTEAVRRNGGLIVVVTNRLAEEEEWTRENLRKLGIEVHGIYPRTDESDKSARWRQIMEDAKTKGRYPGIAPVLVMWVGDQITDFPQLGSGGTITGALSQASFQTAQASAFADFGVRFILLPQPLYSGTGGWIANERE